MDHCCALPADPSFLSDIPDSSRDTGHLLRKKSRNVHSIKGGMEDFGPTTEGHLVFAGIFAVNA